MNNRKITSIDDLHIYEIKEAKYNSENPINKKTRDRPAIFIEESNNQIQRSHIKKSS